MVAPYFALLRRGWFFETGVRAKTVKKTQVNDAKPWDSECVLCWDTLMCFYETHFAVVIMIIELVSGRYRKGNGFYERKVFLSKLIDPQQGQQGDSQR
jgi:hypothetical protein